MGLSKYFSILLLFFLATASAGEDLRRLPVLITKQALSNLRFISGDGKFTYYQRASGSFLLSTNYKVLEVLKGNPGTHYETISSPVRRKILVTQNSNFHNFYSSRNPRKIFQIKFGEGSPSPIGEGISPRLHLADSWASFYNPLTKILHFVNLQNNVLKFNINLSNTLNPYFIPDVAMVDDDRVFYTDLNSEGIPAVLEFRKNSKKITPFLKTTSINQKIEFCLNTSSFYIGQFGINHSNLGSSITKYPASNVSEKTAKTIYQAEKDDFGHIQCNITSDKIFFIQNKSIRGDKEASEVVSLDLATQEIALRSDVTFATQLVDMDGTLLLPYNGKLHIIEGKNDLVRDILPKNLPTSIQSEKPSKKEIKEEPNEESP